MGSRITGLGMNVPVRKLTNDDLSKLVETNDEWVTSRTGIRSRRIAEPGVETSDLCYEASIMAMADAGVTPDEIDLIVVGTASGDMRFPATACFLQMKLGAEKAYAFDVSAACSGFLYALSAADALVRVGRGKKALVVGAEILSRMIDYTDRGTCILFGDGAGAAVIERCDDADGILSCHLHSDGNLWNYIHAPGGGSIYPIDQRLLDERLQYIKMLGNETYKHAVLRMTEVALEALAANGKTIDDVDLFIPHQANLRIIESVGKRLGIPAERVFVNLEEYGNTSAASVPIALAEAKAAGRTPPGSLVLMTAFGAGLTWAGVLVRM